MDDLVKELDEVLRELARSSNCVPSRGEWVDDPALLQVVLDAAKRALQARRQVEALVEVCTEDNGLVLWAAMTVDAACLSGEAAEQRDAERRRSAEQYVHYRALRKREALEQVARYVEDRRAHLTAMEKKAVREVEAGPPAERRLW